MMYFTLYEHHHSALHYLFVAASSKVELIVTWRILFPLLPELLVWSMYA